MLGISLSYLAALAAGIASFLSPCVLPLVPAYLSYVAGTSFERMIAGGTMTRGPGQILPTALMFVAGFTAVFVALGASASAVNALLFAHRDVIAQVAGAVIVVFGLHYLGVFRRIGVFKFLDRDIRFHGAPGAGGMAGALLMGAAFAFGWTPCIGPILASILALAASRDSLSFGASLLAVYALGLGVPFIAAAVALRSFLTFSHWFRQHLGRVERAAGLVLVATGVLMFFNELAGLGVYLLKVFPALGRIG